MSALLRGIFDISNANFRSPAGKFCLVDDAQKSRYKNLSRVQVRHDQYVGAAVYTSSNKFTIVEIVNVCTEPVEQISSPRGSGMWSSWRAGALREVITLWT